METEKKPEDAPRFDNKWQQFEWHVHRLVAIADPEGWFSSIPEGTKGVIMNEIYVRFAAPGARESILALDRKSAVDLVFAELTKREKVDQAVALQEYLESNDNWEKLKRDLLFLCRLCST